jgi:hypothetical protein
MDYQVLKVGYIFINVGVFEFQLFKLVPCLQFAGQVHKFVFECLLEFFPYSRYIVVHWVEPSKAVNHITHP